MAADSRSGRAAPDAPGRAPVSKSLFALKDLPAAAFYAIDAADIRRGDGRG